MSFQDLLPVLAISSCLCFGTGIPVATLTILGRARALLDVETKNTVEENNVVEG